MNTESIRAILDANHGKQVSVKFTKKSGEVRVLKFRPDDYLPTTGTGRKSPEDMFTVVDAEIRSAFDLDLPPGVAETDLHDGWKSSIASSVSRTA